MAILNYAHLTWEDLDGLDRAKTVVFLPISPLEEHGPQLPIGTDFLAAKDMAGVAAEMLEKSIPSVTCLMHPGIPIGCAQMTADFPGTISVGGRAVMQVVLDACTALARHGFRLVVISNHHYEPTHVKAIQVAIGRAARRHGTRVADPLALDAYSNNRHAYVESLDLSRENHADFEETSFMKFKHPDLLKDFYLELPPVHLNLVVKYLLGARTLKKMGAERGYVGSPARATSEYGRKYLEERASLLAQAGERLYRNESLPAMSLQLKAILALTRLS